MSTSKSPVDLPQGSLLELIKHSAPFCWVTIQKTGKWTSSLPVRCSGLLVQSRQLFCLHSLQREESWSVADADEGESYKTIKRCHHLRLTQSCNRRFLQWGSGGNVSDVISPQQKLDLMIPDSLLTQNTLWFCKSALKLTLQWQHQHHCFSMSYSLSSLLHIWDQCFRALLAHK